jgi:uncharacterized protein (DUF362 family)/Pyruvate/2-oxoacid:ferredoxin oxidoreductase delta subunit
MSSIVSIRTCADYEKNTLSAAVKGMLDDLGGLDSVIKTGDRVLLKPNLLMSSAPEKAVVTHPAVVEAVAELVIDAGGKPFIGDGPPFGSLKRVLSKSGYDPFMHKMNIQAMPFVERKEVEFPEGRLFRKIEIAQEVFEFDSIINIAKLKTHCQMFLTMAVKNLFGTLIGTDKASWHMKAGKDYDHFATVLVQICEKVRPTLSVLDGILAMEGNGPNSGTPRHVGVLAASTDPVALDSTVCRRILGFKVENLLTSVIGQAMDLGTADGDRITVVGDTLNGFPLKDFKAPEVMTLHWNLREGHLVRRFLENHLVSRPRIDSSQCECCGICMSHCPPEAIRKNHDTMEIDYSKCISCFCCQELCTNDAISVQQPFIGRLLSRISR